MTTNFGSSNKCRVNKISDMEYHITFENNLMKNSELVRDALVDYEGDSWIIETQSFDPKFGRVEAFLKLEESSNNEMDLGSFTLLYLDADIAKKTIGCPS